MQTTQPENKSEDVWFIDFEAINPRTSIHRDVESEFLTDDKLKWFQVVLPNNGDSPQETKEIREAQLEQVRKGILQVRQQPPSNNTPRLFTDKIEGTLIPKMETLAQQNGLRSSVLKKQKIGPNDPCTCGNGKKFKKCHGRGQFN